MSTLLSFAIAATPAAYVIRDVGSYVLGQTRDKTDLAGGAAVKEFLAGLDWQEVTSGVRADGMGFSACRYFVATLPEGVEAYEAIAEWGSLSAEEQAAVTVRRSPHASGKTDHLNELVAAGIAPVRATQVSMVVGHAEDPNSDPSLLPTVYFWAPGRFTKFTVISDEMAENKGLVPAHATVKLENVE